jgi:hypothetical protein
VPEGTHAFEACAIKQTLPPIQIGSEDGIPTHDTLRCACSPNRCLRALGHLTTKTYGGEDRIPTCETFRSTSLAVTRLQALGHFPINFGATGGHRTLTRIESRCILKAVRIPVPTQQQTLVGMERFQLSCPKTPLSKSGVYCVPPHPHGGPNPSRTDQ